MWVNIYLDESSSCLASKVGNLSILISFNKGSLLIIIIN